MTSRTNRKKSTNKNITKRICKLSQLKKDRLLHKNNGAKIPITSKKSKYLSKYNFQTLSRINFIFCTISWISKEALNNRVLNKALWKNNPLPRIQIKKLASKYQRLKTEIASFWIIKILNTIRMIHKLVNKNRARDAKENSLITVISSNSNNFHKRICK